MKKAPSVRAPRAGVDLRGVVRALREAYGAPAPPPTRDPFALVLWENVAYLATPARRLEAFTLLRDAVGTTPAALLAARPEALLQVTARGILKDTFAEKLRECARIALTVGDLQALVRRGPLAAATKALRAFPGIGEPGAEKILLLSGREALLAPDSNALRVLARVGIIAEDPSYPRLYAAGRRAGAALGRGVAAMQEAHLVLQRHGQTLCKRSAPRCGDCVLEPRCAFAQRQARLDGAGRRR